MKPIKLWLPVFFWLFFIFWLSSQPAPPPIGHVFFDVLLPFLAHFFEFGFFYFLVWRASKKTGTSFGLAIFYAFFDEWHQSWVPTRTPSFFDVLVDVFGIMMAWQTIRLLPRAPRKLRIWAQKLAVI